MHRQRTFLVLATLATTTATSAWGQAESSAVGPTGRAVQAASPIPDFSGPWSHPFLPGFEPPQTGPGPVVNKARVRQVFGDDLRRLPATQNVLVSNPALLVGDYTNPILKPEAAEIVRKLGEISLSGRAFPSPFNQCWPLGLPFVFENLGTEIIQQPDKVTILYPFNHEFRQVRLNERHPTQVTPSWYGDSVGHYEGDALVIDTVGIKIGPVSAVDMYGTPRSPALHVVERYRMLDQDAAKEGWERNARENLRINNDGGPEVDVSYMGKSLQLEFTIEDEGVFTTPWSATVTYRRALDEPQELVCAENRHEYYAGRETAVPTATKPDF